MARPSIPFTILQFRQNSKTLQKPNHQFRNSTQNSIDVVKQISEIIRTKPRWEQTLLSDFPSINFLDPSFLNQVLKHQNNAFFSLRLFYFLTTKFGFSPEHSTCSLIFISLVETNAAKAAKDFLHFTKFKPEPACLESYIRCLCESRLIEEAVDVFDELKKLGTCPALETWNLALLGSVKVGRTDIVWKLYGEMIECGIVFDVDTIGYLIIALCIDSKVSEGYELLRQVLKAGYVPNVLVLNKLISGFVKDMNYSRVSALLHIMITKNCNPSIYTYQHIIHGLCTRKLQREAFRIFNDLKGRGYAPDQVMYTTMLSGLCKANWIGDARKLWFEMCGKGMIPNEYTYNVLLYGFFKSANLEGAQTLYKEMCDRGYGDTTVTYNTMISGWASHGRTEEAFGLFQQMVQKGVPHDAITYNSLIKGFSKEGKVAESANLLQELLEQDLLPSTASYTVLQKLWELGHVDKAKSLWKDMQDRGLEPTACSNDINILGLTRKEVDL